MLRSRHRRQGLSSSHFNFEDAQDLHACDTLLCLATDELRFRFLSRSLAWPAAWRFNKSLLDKSTNCICHALLGYTDGRAKPLSQTSQIYGFSLV
jgi:hypothetical protein